MGGGTNPQPPGRVLVCGSRTLADPHGLIRSLIAGLTAQAWWDDVRHLTVIHGDAAGADKLAGAAAALESTAHIEPYPADWDRHGKAAGPIRNQQMLDEGKPDLVLAFIDKPLAESRGTSDMVRRARKAGVPVYVVQAYSQEATPA